MPLRPDMMQPLPNHDAFLGAYELTDEGFGKDGAWAYVAYLADELNANPAMKQRYLEVATYGRFLDEADLDDTRIPAMPLQHYMVGEAFAQGFLQQLIPSRLLYSHDYTIDEATEILHFHYQKEDFPKRIHDKEECKKTYSSYTLALGEYGLSHLDDAAMAYIDKWAREAYELDDRLRHAFRLGHGVMIRCGMNYQTNLNNEFVKIWSQEADPDEEIKTLFDADSGGESNNLL